MIKDTPMHMAAYRALMELYPPIFCVTESQYQNILAGIKWIAKWAVTQSPETATAYLLACDDLERAIRAHWEQQIKGHDAEMAYQAIVKPPTTGLVKLSPFSEASSKVAE
jgi:hypothetical protein